MTAGGPGAELLWPLSAKGLVVGLGENINITEYFVPNPTKNLQKYQ